MEFNTPQEIVCKKNYKMEDGSVSFRTGKAYKFIFSDNQEYPFLFLYDEFQGNHYMKKEDVIDHFYLFIPSFVKTNIVFSK